MSTLKVKDEDIQQTFPEIWKYLENDDVTDLDFNCGNIWQSRVSRIPEQIENPVLSESYWEKFSALRLIPVNIRGTMV